MVLNKMINQTNLKSNLENGITVVNMKPPGKLPVNPFYKKAIWLMQTVRMNLKK